MKRTASLFCCLAFAAVIDTGAVPKVASLLTGQAGAGVAWAQTLRAGPIRSTALAPRSFLRFYNTGSAGDTVTLTLYDFATGVQLGQWTSPTIPAGAQHQFDMGTIEVGAVIVPAAGMNYMIEIDAAIDGYFQHVVHRPARNTLTNLSTCSAGVTADPRRLSGVNSSLLAAFPSSVVINNTGAAAAMVTLRVYDASNGSHLGTYTSPFIAANAQFRATVATIEAAAGIVPAAGMNHYVIKAEGPFTGFLQHFVNNSLAGYNANMTAVCALDTAPISAPTYTLRTGPIISTAIAPQSFLRFYNTGPVGDAVTVTLYDQATGTELGQWTSPTIPAGAQHQFDMGTVEAGAGIGAPPNLYAIEIDAAIDGYFQHVVRRPAQNTVTNLSSCAAGVTADPKKLSGVNSSNLVAFPSSLVITNTGTAAATATLEVYDAISGTSQGTYTSPSIAPNEQFRATVATIEAALVGMMLPVAGMNFYVITADSAFTGYLQHFVNNSLAGVVTDMTTVCAMGVQSLESAANIYVATTGNDLNSGTVNDPFATFERARDETRVLVNSGVDQVNVYFRGGTYYLPATVLLNQLDKGTTSTEIVYRNYPGESPVFSGGMRIQNWTNTAGNTWEATLPVSTVNFESLFYNDERKLRPRLGAGTLGTYYRVEAPVYVAAAEANCPTEVPPLGWLCFDRFEYDAGDPITDAWTNLTPPASPPPNRCGTQQPMGPLAPEGDIELLVFEKFSAAKLRIECVDTANHIVYFTGPAGVPVFQADVSGFIPEHRYIVENVEDQLTQPGQWFLDRSVTPWILTYLAVGIENPNTDTVIVPQLTHVLEASFLQYVRFQGLAFEHDNYVVPDVGAPVQETFRDITPAVSITNSSFLTFDSVVVARTSGMGLWFTACLLDPGPVEAVGNPDWCSGFGLTPFISNNVVRNSAFYDLGASAIGIGFQQRLSDTDANVPQFMTIENNVIAGYGRVLPNAFGTFQGTAHDITYNHNDIYDGYRVGIHICPCNQAFVGPNSNGAFNNVISYNHVHDLMQGIMNDAGAIRILSGGTTYQALGNRIINNKIHDINDASVMDPDGYGGDGIYIDGFTSFIDVQNNLVYRVSRAGLNITMNAHAPGFASTIRNNVFAYAREAMIQNNRPYPNGTEPMPPIQVFTATNNIFYFDRDDTPPAPPPPPLGVLPEPFYVQGGCTYSGIDGMGFPVPFEQFQHRANNMYWRTDGTFATDLNAFRYQPTAGMPGINTLCNLGGMHTFLDFAGWQTLVQMNQVGGDLGQDLGSVVQDPGFANPAFPADDYALLNGSPGVGFVPFDLDAPGRVRPAFTPLAVPPTFLTQTFDKMTDF